MVSRMPAQKPRNSEQASNDHYDNDKHRRWCIKGNSVRLVLGVGVAALLGTFITIGYGTHQWTSWDQEVDDTLSLWDWKQLSIIESLNIDYEAIAQARERRRRGEERRKRRSRGGDDDLPECTPSPLEKQDTYPKYGCAEIEEMLKGPTKYLGRGFWRNVYLAKYDGQQFAVKTLRKTQDENDRNLERHRWEAAALDAVKDSPNIVHIIGLCDCDMVTEYYAIQLDELLMGGAAGKHFPDDEVIRMALDAARGLQALHEVPEGPVVHADLQPRQLMLDEHGVKLNDLNRCRFMGRDAAGNPCPFRINKCSGVWRSPEEYAGEPQTEKLDIYSMGMIFWSMFGRQPPFERDGDDFYKDLVLVGVRPYVDPSWHQGFAQLFQDMWTGDPSERPTAAEVVQRLEKMLAEF